MIHGYRKKRSVFFFLYVQHTDRTFKRFFITQINRQTQPINKYTLNTNVIHVHRHKEIETRRTIPDRSPLIVHVEFFIQQAFYIAQGTSNAHKAYDFASMLLLLLPPPSSLFRNLQKKYMSVEQRRAHSKPMNSYIHN